ncbi:hypothetical protein F183_A39790 [Bryobacterales bacterium F-183]|nr:hypothetical protein F183_A39790 [Bryobacterales bacterium F-183]
MGAPSSAYYREQADGSVASASGDTRHPVTLSDFCIAKYQVTNAQYAIFCDEAGASFRPAYWRNPEFDTEAKANHPVLYISYRNAQAYCDWVASKTGWKVFIPSEAQWERAARGLTETGSENQYPWGNATAPDDYRTRLTYHGTLAMALGSEVVVNGNSYPYWPFAVSISRTALTVSNIKALAYGEDDERTPDIDESSEPVQAIWKWMGRCGGYTTPVGSYAPTAAGCYDMAGNAFEWTRDFYTNTYYIKLAEETVDPVVEDASVLTVADRKSGSDGSFGSAALTGQATKIIRGGSWYANEGSCQTHRRIETRVAGTGGFNTVGFRIAALPIPQA